MKIRIVLTSILSGTLLSAVYAKHLANTSSVVSADVSAPVAMPVNNFDVVPNASYCMRSEGKEKINGIWTKFHCITFYTFDGNQITQKKYDVCEFGSGSAKRSKDMLDKNAPKPQPVSCKIWYWPACEIRFWFHTQFKGCPGWFISFYDKNGNLIQRYRYQDTKRVMCEGKWRKAGEITVFYEDCRTKFDFNTFQPQTMNKRFPLDLSILKHVTFEDKKKGRYEDLWVNEAYYRS